jgi:selenoprotein W-related protein
LAESILKDYKQRIAGLTLIPDSGGCFEVSVDGVLVFSKLREGRFPEYEEITAHL